MRYVVLRQEPKAKEFFDTLLQKGAEKQSGSGKLALPPDSEALEIARRKVREEYYALERRIKAGESRTQAQQGLVISTFRDGPVTWALDAC